LGDAVQLVVKANIPSAIANSLAVVFIDTIPVSYINIISKKIDLSMSTELEGNKTLQKKLMAF